LIDNLSCVITFGSSVCHIQDKNSLKRISSAEMQDRLYILRILSYQKKLSNKTFLTCFVVKSIFWSCILCI